MVEAAQYRGAHHHHPGIFSGGSIVMQISIVVLIFLWFSDQISGGTASGGCSLWKQARSVQKWHTSNAEKDVQQESVTSSVRMKVYSTGLPKPLRGVLVVVFSWENDILHTIQLQP